MFGHLKILHTLTGVGSAVLAAAVPYPGKVTWISRKGQRSKNYMLHILTLVLLLTRSCKDFRLGVERHSRHACTLFFNPSSNCNKSLNQMSHACLGGVGEQSIKWVLQMQKYWLPGTFKHSLLIDDVHLEVGLGGGEDNPSNGYCGYRSTEYPAPLNTLFQ